MIVVPLNHGYSALIDEADAARVLALRWRVFRNRPDGKLYARRTQRDASGKKTTLYLHRFIMGAPDDLQVDHANNDGLDNRRTNLRLATCSQNRCNTGLTRQNTTGYKGIYFDARLNKFEARIKANGRRVFIGLFDDAVAAAKRYDDYARELHGQFARLNFPQQQENLEVALVW
jgi:hypothetical protein